MHHFVGIDEFKLELQSGNSQLSSKSVIFCPVWPWNLTDVPGKQYGTYHDLLQAQCIISYADSISSYSPETPNVGHNRSFCPQWPRNLTDDLEKNTATFSIPLQAMCIISEPSVNSNWSYVPENPILGLNLLWSLWPWPLTTDRDFFAMTLRLSMVITPNNFDERNILKKV